jgi:hypothetical protein
MNVATRGTSEFLTRSRWVLFLATLVYAATVLYCLAAYASVNWAEYGFSYGGLDPMELAVLIAGLGLWSLVVPRTLHTPSATILIVAYFAVCIPGLVVPLALDRGPEGGFAPTACWMIVSFAGCCIIVGATQRRLPMDTRRLSRAFLPAILVLWVACVVWLVAEYRSVMTLVSLDAIYEQRAAGAATSRAIGYAQTYLGYVLSPALVAFGLLRRNVLLVLLGFAGGIVLYSITAEKNAFSFPFLIGIVAFLLTRRGSVYRSTSFVLASLSAVLAPAVALSASSLVAGFFAWYVGVRSLLTPGLFIAQYSDFFGSRGHTLWSHVTGIGSLVPRPPGLADDRWPSLGHIVGEQYIGKADLNANANFLASDGIAAFGDLGIPIVFGVLALFLASFDRVTEGLDARLGALIALPIGLTLTNVSLFTVLLSFGGLFWLLVLPVAAHGGRGPRVAPSD